MPEDGEALLQDAWDGLLQGRTDPRGRPRVFVTGSAPELRSRLRVTEAAIGCVGTALAAASVLHRARTGIDLSVRIDRGQVAAAMTSERHFRVRGRPAAVGFAALSRFWPASDGWVRTHANFPWHRAALLRALEVPEANADALGAAIASLPAEVVEAVVMEAGGVAGAVRSVDQWRAHPQGLAVAAEPLIGHSVLLGAPPRSRPDAALPATGVRVLDLTRVIAGPVCTRYLGALGADVLRIDPPNKPDLEVGGVADTLLAKRSTCLDLTSRYAQKTVHQLLEGADVVTCGYRPGALDRFGFGVDDLMERYPGLVVVALAAWGHDGPWADRRGFDSVVQAPTGIALRESVDGVTPGALPCQFLDHGTGYLAAAAALDGLHRQMVDGGTHVRRLSLARTAHFLVQAGDQEVSGGETAAIGFDDQWLLELGGDQISAIAPPGGLGDQPLQWPGPPTAYLSDSPEWSA